jgi:hypothetical protein
LTALYAELANIVKSSWQDYESFQIRSRADRIAGIIQRVNDRGRITA